MFFTKRKLKLLTILVSLFLIIFFNISNNEANDEICAGNDCVSFSESKIEILNVRKHTRKEFYTILEYTKVFGEHRFCQHRLEENLIEQFKNNDKFKKIFSSNSKENNGLKYHYLDGCEFKNCFFTCEKDFVDNADALLFHYTDFMQDLKSDYKGYKKLTDKRIPDQIWMMWNDEAAIPLKKYDYLQFNWSVTFYQRSEVWSFAYGGIVDIEKNDAEMIKKDEFENKPIKRSQKQSANIIRQIGVVCVIQILFKSGY